MAIDARAFRNALGNFATGVTVISVDHEGQAHGMTANSFTSVSLAPPLILVCVDNRANSLGMIEKNGKFGVNILTDKQINISRLFAHQKVEEHPAFTFRYTESGVPLLDGALVNLGCDVFQTILAGDHTIFIGEVKDMQFGEGNPLCFFKGQYRELA